MRFSRSLRHRGQPAHDAAAGLQDQDRGDIVAIDVPNRRIEVKVPDEELAGRRAVWQPPKPRLGRGYGWMFTEHILRSNEGCDMDFLQTQFGERAGEPDIF